MNKDLLIGTAFGAVVGSVATAVVLTLVYKKKFEIELEQEIDMVRLDYARHYVDRKPNLADLVQPLAHNAEVDEDARLATAKNLAKVSRAARDEIITEMEYDGTPQAIDFMGDDPVEVLQTQVDHNVFDDNEPDLVVRNPDFPYLISVEEFMDDEPNFEKITLTYFEEDDTLIEEKDSAVIPDSDSAVGDTNLTTFGSNPKDRDTIHVRNERLESDFEVTRDERSYTEVILGVKPDKAEKSGPKKFKGDD